MSFALDIFSESLDKIQDLVEGMFQEVQNTNKTIPRFPGQPCTSDHLQVFSQIHNLF